MFYFYCPKCKYEDTISTIPRGSMSNIRDGYGIPIHHFACPSCGNLDAGAMTQRSGLLEEKIYYQHVIGFYQNIRS